MQKTLFDCLKSTLAFTSPSEIPTMRPIIASTGLCCALAAGFWYALTTTLTDMTMRDCRAGVSRACQQLQQDGYPVPRNGPATAGRDL